MKIRLVCLISFLFLLCISCSVEENARVIFTGDGDWYTVRINMADNWKIANAQLKSNQINLELDKGKEREKHILWLSNPIKNFNEDVVFKGTNSFDGIALLHFTKEDKQQVIHFPLSKSNISKDYKSREVLAVFREGNRLFVDFTIENTRFGNTVFHNLQRQYFGGGKHNHTNLLFNFTKGEFKIEFGENHGENRIFPINQLVEPSEAIAKGRGSATSGKRRLTWTRLYELTSK